MQRVVVAVLASTLVAAGIIALTNVLIHARHPPPPLGTLAWLEPLSCGGWGASARADGYSLRCRSVGTNLTMAEPTSASERISPAACAAFCETTAADAGSGHAWCCQLTAGGESPACAWAEGYPELAETGAGVRSRAYSPCSERLGEAEGLSARRTYSEYACPGTLWPLGIGREARCAAQRRMAARAADLPRPPSSHARRGRVRCSQKDAGCDENGRRRAWHVQPDLPAALALARRGGPRRHPRPLRRQGLLAL